jgi:hypothetical protein
MSHIGLAWRQPKPPYYLALSANRVVWGNPTERSAGKTATFVSVVGRSVGFI